MEHPDYWLTFGNPWEIQRLDIAYDIGFGGRVISTKATPGKPARHSWEVTDMPKEDHASFFSSNILFSPMVLLIFSRVRRSSQSLMTIRFPVLELNQQSTLDCGLQNQM